jgi:hypothetical protein
MESSSRARKAEPGQTVRLTRDLPQYYLRAGALLSVRVALPASREAYILEHTAGNRGFLTEPLPADAFEVVET